MIWFSRPTKRLLLEMSVGVILWNVILAVLAILFLPDFSYPVVPAVITERALDSRNEDYASKLTLAQSLFRKVAFVAALFFFWRVLKIDLLAAVLGAMGMKAGAYLQPLVRKISGYQEEPAKALEQPDQVMEPENQNFPGAV